MVRTTRSPESCRSRGQVPAHGVTARRPRAGVDQLASSSGWPPPRVPRRHRDQQHGLGPGSSAGQIACHSSCCSARIIPSRRITDARLGKIPGRPPSAPRPQGASRVTPPCRRGIISTCQTCPPRSVPSSSTARGRLLLARSPDADAVGPAARRGDGPGRVVRRELQGRPRGPRGRSRCPLVPAGPRHRPGRHGGRLGGRRDPGRHEGPGERVRHRHRASRRLWRAGADPVGVGGAAAGRHDGPRRDGDRHGRFHSGDERPGAGGARSGARRRARSWSRARAAALAHRRLRSSRRAGTRSGPRPGRPTRRAASPISAPPGS